MGSQTLLVRLTGPDHPGITARLMELLDDAGADVHDVEQTSLRTHLNLGVVVTVPEGRDLLKEVLLLGWEQNLTVGFEQIEGTERASRPGHVVTVLGTEIGPGAELRAARRRW